jgi:hypothetical protein
VVCNTAENVDLSVKERARAVVVAAHIQVGHLEPEIDVSVVHFRLNLGIIFFFSRACDHDELVRKPDG